MIPERDHLEIRFPRVEGYRIELPEERLTAAFNEDSILELSPELVGPSITRNSGIIGKAEDMRLEHLGAYCRWAFAEFTEIYRIESDFKARVAGEFDDMIEKAAQQ